mgnify:FL=1
MNQAQTILKFLTTPSKSIPQYGKVHDQKTSSFVPYSPSRLTANFQQQLLAYLDDPPRTRDGQTRFLTALTARQMGKSLSAEYGCYPFAAYRPGWDHVCIADNSARAEYLHRRVHQLHEQWPADIRSPTIPNRESRQLTFQAGGKMRVLSAENGAVGIGQSPDSFHASECAFWADFAGSMFLINPSIINRDECRVIFECTPWERNTPWHNHYLSAKRGQGRHMAIFQPFWDGLLNVRTPDPDSPLTNEEIRLLEQYAPLGLRQEHLAFRRFMMDSDVEIRRKPELFQVFYPFDDVTCWVASTNTAIPDRILQRHQDKTLLQPWKAPYKEYHPPNPDSRYVMGVDPSGHAARDHAAFHILEVYNNSWRQVASFADHIDPLAFTRTFLDAARKYNNARIVVESNGVGQASLSLLREWEYNNIFYEKKRKPGFTSTAQSLDKATGWLLDALMDDLILHDEDTVEQLMSYKHDKRVEESASGELMRGRASTKRRERHHWDKVSALIMAVVGARTLPQRPHPSSIPSNIEEEPWQPSETVTREWANQRWRQIQSKRRRKKRDPWYRK